MGISRSSRDFNYSFVHFYILLGYIVFRLGSWKKGEGGGWACPNRFPTSGSRWSFPLRFFRILELIKVLLKPQEMGIRMCGSQKALYDLAIELFQLVFQLARQKKLKVRIPNYCSRMWPGLLRLAGLSLPLMNWCETIPIREIYSWSHNEVVGEIKIAVAPSVGHNIEAWEKLKSIYQCSYNL